VTPGGPTPARELYGTMLLERSLPNEALAAFEATLNKEPHSAPASCTPNFFWTPARRIRIDKGAMNTGP
jgi:hypothetical protein